MNRQEFYGNHRNFLDLGGFYVRYTNSIDDRLHPAHKFVQLLEEREHSTLDFYLTLPQLPPEQETARHFLGGSSYSLPWVTGNMVKGLDAYGARWLGLSYDGNLAENFSRKFSEIDYQNLLTLRYVKSFPGYVMELLVRDLKINHINNEPLFSRQPEEVERLALRIYGCSFEEIDIKVRQKRDLLLHQFYTMLTNVVTASGYNILVNYEYPYKSDVQFKDEDRIVRETGESVVVLHTALT